MKGRMWAGRRRANSNLMMNHQMWLFLTLWVECWEGDVLYRLTVSLAVTKSANKNTTCPYSEDFNVFFCLFFNRCSRPLHFSFLFQSYSRQLFLFKTSSQRIHIAENFPFYEYIHQKRVIMFWTKLWPILIQLWSNINIQLTLKARVALVLIWTWEAEGGQYLISNVI